MQQNYKNRMPLIALPDIAPYFGNKMTNPWQQPKTSMESTEGETTESAESNTDNSIFNIVSSVLKSCGAYEDFPFDEDHVPPDLEWNLLPIADGSGSGQRKKTQSSFPIIDQSSAGPSAPSLEIEIKHPVASKRETGAVQTWSQSGKHKVAKSPSAWMEIEDVRPIIDQSTAAGSAPLLALEIEQPASSEEESTNSPTSIEEVLPLSTRSIQQSPSSSANQVEEEDVKATLSKEPDANSAEIEADVSKNEIITETEQLHNGAELDRERSKTCECFRDFLLCAVPSVSQEKLLHKFDFSEPNLIRRICDQTTKKYGYKGKPDLYHAPITDDDIFEVKCESSEEPKTPSPFDSPIFTTKSKLQRRIELQRQQNRNLQAIYEGDDLGTMEQYTEVQTQRKMDESLVLTKLPSLVLDESPSAGSSRYVTPNIRPSVSCSSTRKHARQASTTTVALAMEEEEDEPCKYYDPRYSQPTVRQTARKAARLMSEAFERSDDDKDNGTAPSSKKGRKRKAA